MGLASRLLGFFSQGEQEKRILDDKNYYQLKERLSKGLAEVSFNSFQSHEEEIIRKIKAVTAAGNKNNETRTHSYLEFYLRHPEVHWAFLAHMVSRNGGWNMTDLKGSLVGDLLGRDKKELFFLFLERSNAFIFYDAFPQLLLYEESKRANRPLFHLLPAFHVSSFMRPLWEWFYQSGNSRLITVGLIINEQNYIEKRVIQNPLFKANVLDSPEFSLQELFGFTEVLFPHESGRGVRLAGLTVRDFSNVQERIQIGKRLYGILFENRKVFNGVLSFARGVPHTASRADFWGDIFSKSKSDLLKIYSPELKAAWKDRSHQFHDKSDWFVDLSVSEELKSILLPKKYDETAHYAHNLARLTAIDIAKNLLK